MSKKWNEQEICILKENINEPYNKIKSLLPGREIGAIIGKKDKLKLRRKSIVFWTDKEDAYLIKNYPNTTIENLEKRLNKGKGSIFARINRLKKAGFIIKNKKEFLSTYWKNRYIHDKKLIDKHKIAIKKLWSNESFRKKHKKSIRKLFKNKEFSDKFRASFIERRNSKLFRFKQRKIASKFLTELHKNPSKHKRLLSNLRKNPSNQQINAVKHLRKIFGYRCVGCNDWKILDNRMEVDIPIYPFKIAIEWDGEYWHKIKKVKNKDNLKNLLLTKKGWSVIRVISPSNKFQSKEDIQNRFDIMTGTIAKILLDKELLN